MSRNFVRHPVTIPIHVMLEEVVDRECDFLKDISVGGVCFIAQQQLNPGAIVQIQIPIVHPRFVAEARVAWCRPNAEADSGGFETGVEFLTSDTAFRARMVEQVCHIEDYKRRKMEEEGLKLTNEEAALEWIQQNAKNFPYFYQSLKNG